MSWTKESFVAFDLSLTSTGWATHEGTGTIQSKLKDVGRLDDISIQVLKILLSAKSPVVALEGYAFAKRSSHAHAQGELGGVIRLQLYQANIPYVEIPPTNRAKFATGKGNANKAEVVSHISAKTGIVWSGSGADDECDAWVLREMMLAKFGFSEYDWSADSMSALDKIDWSRLPYCKE